ncbi:thymidylate synthase [Candidatus Nitrosacidococcus sp. I8]|uniref:thymidylate synthase n=1 Tax=Candidatus Nitrosacidococcus sp. I8 TaxID=2942908 RepID=UPI0022279D69|nr:thymidylate synthase [Candidatus Nitrosacidococcus sp. I8]CAH9014304.1 Thymidylate synthase [Candidatus Nitrosacidococcus sp. I8]
MQQYLNLLKIVLETGKHRGDRTGMGTQSIFGYQMRFDLQRGFPLVTTKKLHTRSIFVELLWFLKGDTNIQYLHEHSVTIWDEWADTQGELGPVYGKQWRAWPLMNGETLDQISSTIDQLKSNPYSRRHVVVAYNPADIDKMALPPCHALFQFYIAENKLSCQLYQRSADLFLGVPFNIASYALLTHLVAEQCNLEVGEFIWTGGDIHLYQNHIIQTKEQLTRTPYLLPKLHIKRKPSSIFEYSYEDLEILDYKSHPTIKAAISI